MTQKSERENEQEDQTSPSLRLLDYLQGQGVFAVMSVAVQLGLPDLIKDGPRHVQELAVATNTHQPSLYRLLRALAYLNIVVEVEPETFAPTEFTAHLCSDRPDSLYFITKMYGQEWQVQAWNHLEYSIRTGKAAVDHVYGTDLWTYFGAHPEQGQIFNQAMTGLSGVFNPELAQAYDFSRFGTVVDLGGGQGSLLKTILSRYPHLQGILFDQPSVIESARHLVEPSLQGRLRLLGGDLLKAAPEGGDVYMLKLVLHDWPNEDCLSILRNCRQAMKPEARLLIIDPLIIRGTRNNPISAELLDLLMLVNSAGSERTAEEYEHLLTSSGFKLSNIVMTTDTPYGIVEAIPA